ncbi:MAG: hypothetical protein AB7Q81_21665 [Gammaproteobacteria bacterium]
MSSGLVATHVAFVGIWLGCILTEAIFERALLGKGRDKETILAALHKKVDVVVEIPAFVVVLVTGALLLKDLPDSTTLNIKIGFGLIAILANAYCVYIVFRRAKCAEKEDWEGFGRLDHMQHKVGGVVLLGVLVALGMGIFTA